MKAFKWLAIFLSVLLAAATVLPFLVPLASYIPEVEKQASEKLKEPVKIGALRLALLPVPRIVAKNIAVGRIPYLQIKSVSVIPDLFSLLEPVKVLKSIELDGVTVAQEASAKIPGWTQSDGSPAAVVVRRVRFKDLRFKLKQAPLGPFEGEVQITRSGGLEQARLQTADGKAKFMAQPEKPDRYAVRFNARDWKLPAGPAIHFDELDAAGHATSNELRVKRLTGKLYGGSLEGSAGANWRKDFQVKGELDTKGIGLDKLVPLIERGLKVGGKLDSRSVFSSRAQAAGQLLDAARADSDFSVKDGVLHGVDIVEAAKSLVKGGAKGGQTRFQDFSGHMALDRGSYRFTGIKISSGVLAANGNVDISPQKELSGKINAEVKAGVSLVTVPLAVSGTVKEPFLRPTGAAMAGAAAGTVMLGPGVGTALGTKAGAFFDKLFGKPKEKK